MGAWARIHAARGDPATADDVQTLLGLVAEGPWRNVRAEALRDAAHATAALGDRTTAAGYAREALEISETKENRAFARQLERLLVDLGS